MKIYIISVGKLDKIHQTMADTYRKMISDAKIIEHEITYSKKIPANNIKKFEAELIAKKINDFDLNNPCIIAMDEHGQGLTSKDFSNLVKKMMLNSRSIIFVIGGAFGLDQSVLDRAEKILSLSDMTLPHQMAKLILLEQVYRAETIRRGHPYHK